MPCAWPIAVSTAGKSPARRRITTGQTTRHQSSGCSLPFRSAKSDDPRSLQALAGLARRHGEEAWLDGAILSSLGNRAGKMLKLMLSNKTDTLGQARGLIHRLCSAVASRKNPEEFSDVIVSLKRTR